LDKDTELFEQKLKEKLVKKDFNFRGYFFPEWAIFDFNFRGYFFPEWAIFCSTLYSIPQYAVYL